MGYRLITAPATNPVSLAEACVFLRREVGEDDDRINALIAAATSFLDGANGMLGRCLVSQTWELVLDEFSDAIKLGLGPVTSITSVKYYDTAGDEQTLSADYYTADLTSDPQWIVLNSDYSWPDLMDGVNAVTIRFVAGYAAVPETVKQAILFLTSAMYSNGGAIPDDTWKTVHALLANTRAFSL